MLEARVVPPPDWNARVYRVLLVRYGRIGDMIMSTALIRAIAQSHRTIELDVLASPENAAVLVGNPFVHHVIPFERHRWQSFPLLAVRLRRAHYDAVIDVMVLDASLTTALLMVSTGAPYRIGVAGRNNEFLYTVPVTSAGADAHHVDQMATTGKPFGVHLTNTDWRLELHLAPDEIARGEAVWCEHEAGGVGRVRVLVNISAFLARRRWPDDRTVELLRRLRSVHDDLVILVIGAPADADRVVGVARAAGAAAVHTPRVRDAFAVVAAADLVVTPDTGISHAAAAVRTPALVLLPGDADGRRFTPYGNTGGELFSDSETLASLAVEPVAAACEALLSAAASRHAAARRPRPSC
jgi:ADP-heptose:LPS heptosyltransferase